MSDGMTSTTTHGSMESIDDISPLITARQWMMISRTAESVLIVLVMEERNESWWRLDRRVGDKDKTRISTSTFSLDFKRELLEFAYLFEFADGSKYETNNNC